MVVLAIIGIITAVTLNSQSSFNKTLILANTAYDIALTLRSAETFGISSRAAGAVANAGYGLHFQRGTAGFILFADTSPAASCGTPDCKPGDHIYNAGSDVLIQTYALGNAITISDFCAFSAGSWSCEVANGGTLNSLDISFARPNPDAFIRANGSPYTAACLKAASPQGGAQNVSLASSGAITANAASCP
jgi:hypothetical protein